MDSFLCTDKRLKPVDVFPARFAGKEQLSSRWQAVPREDALPRDCDFIPWPGRYRDGQRFSCLPRPKRDVSLLLGVIKAGGSGSRKEAPCFGEKDATFSRS